MDISKFVTIGEDGKLKIDNEAFNAELDRERTKASETASKNTETKLRSAMEKEIREQLKQEAEMSAEQKLQAERAKLLEERKAFDIERIKKIYKDANISDTEVEILLASVGEDSAKNLETAQKFAEARKVADENYKKKVQEEFQFNDKNPNNGNTNGVKSLGEQMAERLSHREENKYVDLSPKTGE